MTNLAFAPGVPLFGRPALASSVKCTQRYTTTYASAAASPRPAVTSTASDNATPNAVANGGTLVTESTNSTMESIDVGPQLDLGPVTTLSEIGEISQLAEDFDLADFRIESGGVTIEITRAGGRGFVDGVLRERPTSTDPVMQPTLPASTSMASESMALNDSDSFIDVDQEPVATKDAGESGSSSSSASDPNEVYDSDFIVKSNRVGFFFSGARNKPPLVNVGDHVAFNQPVCIIEQLGQQYVYLSEVSGTVTKIFVEDGDAVQYDDHVMVIRPD